MDLFDLVAKISLDTKGFDNGIEQSEGKASRFANKLKSGLSSAGKIAGVGLAAAAAGIVEIGKSAISAYADYEQLVGGVDTLFKESSKKVQEYAENAYKTAGMSANEYMETVTSFSASLLQSLDGDTNAAAESANQALTDMSDNANKMGTSMESIQYAYQGFAKQNYTMLDNLKLGYGGTKEEMMRLLSDAEKLSGVKYDISNLDDVYEAIHVVQTELGITGTTAKEASSTISGSIGMLKGAWKNLLSGLADKNADVGKLASDVIESVSTVSKNIVPVIVNLLPQISTALVNLVNGIIPQIIPLIQTTLPSIVAGALELVTTLATTITENMPTILQTGTDIIFTLISGITESLPELIPAAAASISELAKYLTAPENLHQIIESAIDLILSLSEGLIGAIPDLVDAAVQIIIGLTGFLLTPENLELLVRTAVEIILTIAGALISSIPTLGSAAVKMITGIVEKFTKYDWSKIGSNLLTGIWNGISNKVEWLKRMVKGVVDKIKGWFTGKDGFDTHSPSKWGAKIGKYVDEGLAMGFVRGEDEVLRASASVADGAKLNLSGINSSFGLSVGAGTKSGISAGMNLGGVSVTLNIENFSHNTAEDIKDLAETISEMIAESAQRRTAAYA